MNIMKENGDKQKKEVTVKRLGDTRPRQQILAEIFIEGQINAATIIDEFGTSIWGKQPLELSDLMDALDGQAKKALKGNTSGLEIMLTNQVASLETIYTSYAMRSSANAAGGYIEAAERYLRLALKAQNQCRATIDTLIQIKNPRHTVITKQANISNGPQQVNNTLNQSQEPDKKTQKISETSKNKLLDDDQENPYMDGRAESKAGRDNPAMAAVETIHRAAH